MSINEDKLKKANEFNELYGNDIDEIMLMEESEFKKAYDNEPLIFGNYDYYCQNVKLNKSEFGRVENSVLNYLNKINEIDFENFEESYIMCQLNILKLMKDKLDYILSETYAEIENVKNMISNSIDHVAKYELQNEDLHYEYMVCNKVKSTIDIVNLLNSKLRNCMERSR